MKQRKKIVPILLAVMLLASTAAIFAGCGHEHSFGEWEVRTPADCENAALEVRTCECGEEETREGESATGHSLDAISARCLLEKPMATMTVTPEDVRVTGTCAVCGGTAEITEGITVENGTLVLGENTVTVTYGELSTSLTIQAEELDIALNAVVTDDTYAASGSKDKDNSEKKDMGTVSDQYRVYFRVNMGDILNSDLFKVNQENAKVRLILTVTSGTVTDKSTFTLKAYDPSLTETDADFSKLTWNSLDNKEGSLGAYTKLHWANGTQLVSGSVGHNVSADDGKITITLAYSQIAEFADAEGNILLAFATNSDGLKVGSLENKTETNRPVFQIVLNDEHFHIFDQKNPQRTYLASAGCKEKAKYYVSCACGAAGTETFEYGTVAQHSYSALVPKVERTCTEDGVRAHYRCTACGKYFIEKDGKKVAVSLASLKIEAGHNCGKLIAQKDATCTATGLMAHYQCSRCKAYFIEVDGERVETTKEKLKIAATGHTYSDLIPRVEKTCTTDGMKEHYRCTECGKYFVEKDGKMVATSESSLVISASHKFGKLVEQKDPTCTEEGRKAHYRCDVCKGYFIEVDGQKVQVTKEDLIIPATGHTYSDLVPRKEKTCTEDGMKAHYRCTVCWKYFVEKDGKKVATSEMSLKISAGHDLITKYDDASHWSECSQCGYEMEHEAHSGGTATETEQAVCQVCGQPYGELLTGVTWFGMLLALLSKK